MSYSVEEIKKATKECRPLKSRVGALINAKQLTNSPTCGITCKEETQSGGIAGGFLTTTICRDKSGKVVAGGIGFGGLKSPALRPPKMNNEEINEIPPTSNNKMAWLIGGIAVAGIVYFMFIKK